MITNEHGCKLSINYAGGDTGKGSYHDFSSILPGLTEFTYSLRRISSKLLESLGRHLIPGRSYRICVSGPADRNTVRGLGRRPRNAREGGSQDRGHYGIAHSPSSLARQSPFTTSIAAPWSIFHTSNTPPFHIINRVTSLERKAVPANVRLDSTRRHPLTCGRRTPFTERRHRARPTYSKPPMTATDENASSTPNKPLSKPSNPQPDKSLP